MKLLILTINEPFNYGNRLQNYALSKVLSSYGEVRTLQTVLDRERLSFFGKAKQFLKRPLRSAFLQAKHSPVACKEKRFLDFTNRFIPTYGTVTSNPRENRIPKGWENAALVIGSDQVWNYTFGLTREDLKMRFGETIPKGRCISYAASIGIDEIDEEWFAVFHDGLTTIDKLSVREDRAAELVKKLSGRSAEVVLDPTLLLTAPQWLTISNNFITDPRKYVLTYFLGKPSTAQKELIDKTAADLGATIRELNNPQDFQTFSAGPAEFVELFSKAEYIFTDSYHACCFATIFNKNFKVFSRAGFSGKDSMNSRMKTLFRLFEFDNLLEDEYSLSAINWNKTNQMLESYRTQSKLWLDEALNSH